jgi:hypothetical protein
MLLRFANQPFLLADHTAGLLQLFRHRNSHTVDNIQDALFVDQQPAAEEDSPAFRQRIFKLVNQLI